MKVVGIGACVLDTYIECDKYPTEDSKQRATNTFKMGGGPVANALVTFAKVGGEAEYIGGLSKDADGDQLVKEFEKFGVKISNVKLVEKSRAFTSYIIVNSKHATRTVLFDKGSVPDDPKFICEKSIKNADVLHLDGNNLKEAIAAAKIAKKNKVLVSLDAGSNYPGIDKLLPYVNILISSADFACKFTGEKNLKKAILKLNNLYHPMILAATNGKHGGVYIKDNKASEWKSYKVDAIDTNGCGDAFHGAFLFYYLKTNNLEESLKFASALVAIRCQSFGLRNSLPNYSKVIKFMKEHK